MLDSSARTTEPFTGDEYLESLRDGREVYVYGERVDGRHDPPGLPQHRPLDRAPLRRAARSRAARGDHDPDRHRQRRRDPQVLPLPADRRGLRRRPRGDRRVGAARLRLARAQPGLQGRVPGHARRQRGLLRPLPGQRAALVPRGPGARPLLEPRDHPSRRSTATGRPRRSATCSCTSSRSATTASSSAAPRSSPPGPRSRTTTSSPTTGRSRCRRRSTRSSARSRWTRPA